MTASAFDPAALGADPPEFDDPFAILEACHGRIDRMLRTLGRLGPHVAAHGVDHEAREAIARVRRHFEVAGPDHHADEELDLFPAARAAARAAGDAAQLAVIDRLVGEHRVMEADWSALRGHLDALLRGEAACVDASLVAGFVTRYRDHVAREEAAVFRVAGPRLDAACRAALAAAMVARRAR